MLLVGSTISHFKILEKLGEGGMGIVYKARDQLLDRLVAIKVLPSLTAATEERRQRFVLEAKSASALNHPNIVTIFEIGAVGEITFIAMEYVDGRALHEELRAGRLSIPQTLDYGVQLIANSKVLIQLAYRVEFPRKKRRQLSARARYVTPVTVL
jgi:serine/threonine protein kinase